MWILGVVLSYEIFNQYFSGKRRFRHFLRTNKVLPTPTPPRNIPQKAIILPTQTFNFFESYINATSMYARTTFLAPIIPAHIALGTPPA